MYDKILALKFRDALETTWELVTALNRAIDERKPWALFKEERHYELDALFTIFAKDCAGSQCYSPR